MGMFPFNCFEASWNLKNCQPDQTSDSDKWFWKLAATPCLMAASRSMQNQVNGTGHTLSKSCQGSHTPICEIISWINVYVEAINVIERSLKGSFKSFAMQQEHDVQHHDDDDDDVFPSASTLTDQQTWKDAQFERNSFQSMPIHHNQSLWFSKLVQCR